MRHSSIAALFGTMFVLALLPSPSVLAVVASSIASGFIHGLATVIGIVIGDFIFIILAIYGLSALTETIDSLFIVVKYLGAAYLIWLGIELARSKSQILELPGIREASYWSNFLTGLLITLADHKAIFFYMSFFPAFIDLSKVSIVDTSIIMVIATMAIGGAKLGYAYMADRARFLWQSSRAQQGMRITAAIIMIGTGIFLIAKT